MIKKILNILLLLTFILTLMVPLTGIMVHKLVSALFLILCIIHTVVYWKKLNKKRIALLGVIFICFVSGILGMIFDQIPMVMAFHKLISIASVFMLAIHIFIFWKRLK